MTVNEAKQALYALKREITAYEHAEKLLQYDGDTTAPRGTAANRARTLEVLEERAYRLRTGEEMRGILETLNAHRDELDEITNRIVTLDLKDLRRLSSIPMEEYLAYQTLIVEAGDVWHRAKEQNDYPMFEPYLRKIVDTLRRFAGLFEPGKPAYDVWLDTYEEGLTMEKCDTFFEALRETIVPLVKRIGEVPQIDNGILHGNFPVPAQEKLSDELMEIIGIDREHCGIGTTEHPFTIDFSKYDVRITTHYHEEDFSSSMFSVIHEGGHALYELHTADELAYTGLGTGVSMGIHESQSRFFENILGRSRAFCEYLFPKLCELFPEQMKGYTAEDYYRAVNRAEPSLIRTEADELTYCLHVMVRYDIERRLMDGTLDTKDVPAAWAEGYKKYLGIEVPNDRCGALQDSHWSGGSLGYFPSYALGSAYGAQILQRMKQDVDVDSALLRGDFAPINNWLTEHIWQYGSLRRPTELLESALGEPFDVKCYTKYLKDKYEAVYGLK